MPSSQAPDEHRAYDPPKLRVLVLSHYFWPETFRINQVVDDLIDAGAEITVLTGHPNYPEGRVFDGYDAREARVERRARYDIVRVPVVPRGRSSHFGLAFNYLSFTLMAAICGSWLLRGRRFDVIFVYCTTPVIQGYAAIWLRFLKRAKLVLWVQDLWPQALSATGFVKAGILLRLVEASVVFLYRRCDLILAQSHAFVANIATRAGRVPVRYFPNPGEHLVEGARGSGRLPQGKFNVVFAGNLGKVQALDTVVAAASLLRDDPDIHITLFGSGAMSEWIAGEIVARSLDNLTLGGRLPSDAMPEIYSDASALLLTLVDDQILSQTVPSKLQSYLASGRPVVAAVNGEAAEIVGEAGAGVSCRAQDPEALAGAIAELRSLDAGARAAMGEAARRYFDAHYEPRALAGELKACLARLVAGTGRPGRETDL